MPDDKRPPAISQRTRDNINLAETRFRQWLECDLDGKLEAPRRRPNLGSLGWSKEILDHEVARIRLVIEKRIEIYRQVYLAYDDPEMLSSSNLDALKNAVLRTKEVAKTVCVDRANRELDADGAVTELAARAVRNRINWTFDSRCLGVINTAIQALAAEATANRHRRRGGGKGRQEPNSDPSSLSLKEPDLERAIAGKRNVEIGLAARYLDLTIDHVRRLVLKETLKRVGLGRPIKISTKSLRIYKGTARENHRHNRP
jgi:hypothetical protein